jgi:acetyl-CoA carboxylase biotin carboxyl carrier protein
MNQNFIKKLIKLVEESDIESLEVSHWGRKVKIIQRLASTNNGHQTGTTVVTAAAPAPAPQAAAPVASEAPADTGNLVAITSPMVGTFYSAPAPDADPYVSLNEKITAGQVVCIVEAMKLMNEIEADTGGRVVKIEVENAQPVEFGQTLFWVDPNG